MKRAVFISYLSKNQARQWKKWQWSTQEIRRLRRFGLGVFFLWESGRVIVVSWEKYEIVMSDSRHCQFGFKPLLCLGQWRLRPRNPKVIDHWKSLKHHYDHQTILEHHSRSLKIVENQSATHPKRKSNFHFFAAFALIFAAGWSLDLRKGYNILLDECCGFVVRFPFMLDES